MITEDYGHLLEEMKNENKKEPEGRLKNVNSAENRIKSDLLLTVSDLSFRCLIYLEIPV